MSDETNIPSSAAAEAADWYARLRGGNVSELDAARFRAWLAGNPRRRQEFEAIDGCWDKLAALEHSPEVLRERAAIAARRRGAAHGATKYRSRLRFSLAAAATVLIALGASYLIRQQQADRYVTDIGEQRTVPLADGSVVTLNTATEIRVHYSPERRRVELVSGQANFEVARQPGRPFVVTAGDGEVRALGTMFDVYKSGRKVTVTLIEGKVAVIPASAASGSRARATAQLPAELSPAAQRADEKESSRDRQRHAASQAVSASGEIFLAAGEQLSYVTGAASVRRASADLGQVAAWRARKLDFSDTLLSEAIAEANRYSHEQIVLQAPELEHARISGTFEAGKNQLFVEGLQSYFHLDAERTERRIVLTARH